MSSRWIAAICFICVGQALCSSTDSQREFLKISPAQNQLLKEECSNLNSHAGSVFKLLSGGLEENYDLFNFMVQIIHVKQKGDGKLDIVSICSGAVISDIHIITAASCFDYEYNGIVNTPLSEFKIYGGSFCLYMNKKQALYDNIVRKECPDVKSYSDQVLSIKPISLLIPMASVISNLHGIPFYGPYSDIAIFEVESLSNIPKNHDYDLISPICIASPLMPERATPVYTIASFGRRKEILESIKYNDGENPINVRLNIEHEYNVHINKCPSSIHVEACKNIIIIEPDLPAAEGDNGSPVMVTFGKKHFLVGVLSARENVGPAYKKYILATHITEFHRSICNYTGICMLENSTDILSESEQAILITKDDDGKSVFGNGTSIF
ncbi:unnamed protein product [Thelazia callipaeda]|uniref:Peptidase S1 domain-containing protein n=1 Tax=Thelazia callipaeda TaxID=103827 RepID=A0A0N5CY92_THECL|nr:unnamed protein product [Thelazia callipaeda]